MGMNILKGLITEVRAPSLMTALGFPNLDNIYSLRS